ncbi:MAG: acyltransferase, partial [Microbacterium sp.]
MTSRPTKTVSAMRADIQGLRALAVTMVVVFHLYPRVLSGGYVGVDVFFVISGYLITGHLLREVQETGSVRVGRFWARRARRLLPAAFTVLAVSVLAVWIVLPITALHQNFTEIGFAAGYVLNWRLAAMSVDYLGADDQPSIVQHFWSLSVEEQFYLVWPVLILLVLWGARWMLRDRSPWRKPALAGALALVFAVSLTYSAVATEASPPEAYFATTTRAWEFAAGGLLCFLPALRVPEAVRAVLGWLAVAAIVLVAATYSGRTAFPGVAALLPVLATALLIHLGGAGVGARWSPQRFADVRPVRFLGDVSYAVYL